MQIACSFLVDSLEALGSTCTLVAQGLDRRCASSQITDAGQVPRHAAFCAERQLAQG